MPFIPDPDFLDHIRANLANYTNFAGPIDAEPVDVGLANAGPVNAATLMKRIRKALLEDGCDDLVREEQARRIDCWQRLRHPVLPQEGLWQSLVAKIFYANNRAAAVTARLPAIQGYLGNPYNLLQADWDVPNGRMAATYLQDRNVFRSEPRLRNVVSLARRICNNVVVADPALDYFFPNNLWNRALAAANNRDALLDIAIDVFGRLRGCVGIGPATALHVLMDLGFPVIKSDTILTRTAVRLGIIIAYDDNGGQLVNVGPAMNGDGARRLNNNGYFVRTLQAVLLLIAEQSGFSVRATDWVIVKLGQQAGVAEAISRTICADGPDCHKCPLVDICKFGSQR